MILDEKLEFCDATSVALTAGATVQNIGDILDTDAARDLGNGEPLYLVITVDTAIITAGSAGTITFQLVSDSTDTIATDGTQTVHFRSKAFVTDDAALNDLDVGETVVCVALPYGGDNAAYERYLALQTYVLTTDTTAGKINAFLTREPAHWKAYDSPSQA
jgi:hypothetical protein